MRRRQIAGCAGRRIPGSATESEIVSFEQDRGNGLIGADPASGFHGREQSTQTRTNLQDVQTFEYEKSEIASLIFVIGRGFLLPVDTLTGIGIKVIADGLLLRICPRLGLYLKRIDSLG